MVSNQEDLTIMHLLLKINLSRRSNSENFMENATKVSTTVSYLSLAIQFSVNLPGRNFQHNLKVVEDWTKLIFSPSFLYFWLALLHDIVRYYRKEMSFLFWRNSVSRNKKPRSFKFFSCQKNAGRPISRQEKTAFLGSPVPAPFGLPAETTLPLPPESVRMEGALEPWVL